MEWWSNAKHKTEKHHNLLFLFQYFSSPILQYSLVLFQGMAKELCPRPEDVVFQDAIQ